MIWSLNFRILNDQHNLKETIGIRREFKEMTEIIWD